MKQPQRIKFSRLGKTPILARLVGVMAVLCLTPGFTTTIFAATKSIYLIGDFNDWNLPTLSDSHGAIKFEKVEVPGNSPHFKAIIDAPAGDSEYAICHLDDDTGRIVGFGGRKNEWESLELFDYSGPTDAPESWREYYAYKPDFIVPYYGIESSDGRTLKSIMPYVVKNWVGGEITVWASNVLGSVVQFETESAPTYVPQVNEDRFYLIVQSDECAPQIIERDFLRCKHFTDDYTIMGADMLSFIVSTEKSLTPSPENVWGLPEDMVFENEEDFRKYYTKLPMVKGGYPYRFKASKFQSGNLEVDWPSEHVSFKFGDIQEPTSQNTFYIIEEDGVRSEIRPCVFNQTTGFIEPIKGHGHSVKIYVMGCEGTIDEIDDDPDNVVVYGPYQQDWMKLPTDELYQNQGYDKQHITPRFGGDATKERHYYMAEFKDYGCLEVDVSIAYRLSYTHYEGELISSSGIDCIMDEPAQEFQNSEIEPAVYYDLSGRIVDYPEKGIYIRKLNGRYDKVAL